MRGRRQRGTAADNSREQQRTADKMKKTLSLLILVVLSVLQGQAQGSCPDTFLYYDNQYVVGGTYVGVRSTADCKDDCSASSSTCYGIGIKDGNKCYLVLFVHSGTTWDTDWERYQRSTFTCQGSTTTTTTTTTAPCQESFLYYDNQYVVGGTLVAGVSTTQACKDECQQSSSTCYGIGIKDGNKCYLVLFVHSGTTWDTDWERYQRSTFNC